MTTKIIPPTFITQSEDAYDKGYDPKVARGLLQFLKPYYGQMLIALVFMIIVTAASVSGPYFVKLAIDKGISKNNLVALRNIVLIYGGFSRPVGHEYPPRADHVAGGAAYFV